MISASRMLAMAACLAALSLPIHVFGQEEPPVDEAAVAPASESDAVVEEVLVTGEQPGPGLWKVSSGEHTLWILGTHQPLPKKMRWKSKDVEALIAESQEVIKQGDVDVDANIGFFKALTLIPAALAARKNPDGKTLEEVLPSEAYAKWLEVKQKHIGNDRGIEKFRPIVAALELRQTATKKSGLSYDDVIWPVVEKAAKKNKVKIIDPVVHIDMKIDKPREILKKFAKAQMPDLECFSNTINRLDADLEAMRLRANAWAVGDIEAIERLNQVREGEDCVQMLIQALIAGADLTDDAGINEFVRGMRDQAQRAESEMKEKWFAAIDHALANNTTSFAVMSVGELVRPDGRLAKLREKGYEIIPP